LKVFRDLGDELFRGFVVALRERERENVGGHVGEVKMKKGS